VKVGEHDPLQPLIEQRRLPADLFAKYGVYVEPRGPLEGWIAIPYPHLSGVWYVRHRHPDLTGNPSPKYLTPKGEPPHLYNPLHLGPGDDEVWVTEGELDCLTLLHIGYPAVGVAGTNAFSKNWVPLFETARVVVAFDGDPSGREAAMKLAGAFAPRSYVFPMPDDDDVSSWWVRDPGGLKAALRAFREENGL